MLRTIIFAITVCAASVAGGAASVWYVLEAREGVGIVEVDGWQAAPVLGTPDADPYAKARFSREAMLALGRAEGIVFHAERDRDGNRLRRECSYRIEGQTPTARLWTLHLTDDRDVDLAPVSGRAAATHSRAVIRDDRDGFAVAFGPVPQPGNWLPTSGSGPLSVALTLYDTTVADGGFDGVELPDVVPVGCDA